MIDLKEVKIPLSILKTIDKDYEISNISDIEFSEIILNNIWEIFIQNSLEWNSKQKLDNNFLSENFINTKFENELISIYQNIYKKLQDKDLLDFKINEKLLIKSENLEKTLKSILNIILANNISYLKKYNLKNNKTKYWLW